MNTSTKSILTALTIGSMAGLLAGGAQASTLTWEVQHSNSGAEALWAVSVIDDDFAVATGAMSRVLRYDGSSWETFPGAADPWNTAAGTGNEYTTNLFAVTVIDADDIWVGSQGGSVDVRGVSHWDGTTWSEVSDGGPNYDRVYGLWSAGSDLVVSARASGRVTVYDGSTWSRPLNESGNFHAVGGSGADNIWAVGASNMIYTSTDSGSTFAALAGPASTSTQTWRGVTVLSDTAAWVVGDNGTIAFWDGTAFSLQTSGTNQRLNAAVALADNDVYAVGANGTVLHFDGDAWSAVDMGFATTSTFYDVAASSTGSVYIVGDNEQIIRGVPEPGSFALAAAGSVLLMLRRRR